MHHLIVIAGPTAIGKTNLSLKLASAFKSEIISADSRQLYNELTIGSAKPSVEELNSIPHHFINYKSITEDYSAGQFEKDVLAKLEQLFKKTNVIFMVGGSGLYINAVCNGFDDFPDIEPIIREQLNIAFDKFGLEYLQKQVQIADPEYYKEVDLNNPMRLIRALEIYRGTGKTYSSYRTGEKVTRPFKIVKIALDMDRELLYKRINSRVDIMLEQGLLEEVKKIVLHKKKTALQTVGYQELFEYLEGNISFENAVELIKQNSRRYAKRQLTWLRRDEQYQWFSPNNINEITEYIKSKLS